MTPISRRSFLAALGIGTASAVIAPKYLWAWTPEEVSAAKPLLDSTEPVEFSSTDMEQLAKYCLQEIQKLVPGKFATTDTPTHFFGSHFEWDREYAIHDRDDPAHLKRAIDNCIKLLAEECKSREIKAFGKPDLPSAVDMAAVVTNPTNNMSLRIVRAYDIYHQLMINRIDMAGA